MLSLKQNWNLVHLSQLHASLLIHKTSHKPSMRELKIGLGRKVFILFKRKAKKPNQVAKVICSTFFFILFMLAFYVYMIIFIVRVKLRDAFCKIANLIATTGWNVMWNGEEMKIDCMSTRQVAKMKCLWAQFELPACSTYSTYKKAKWFH